MNVKVEKITIETDVDEIENVVFYSSLYLKNKSKEMNGSFRKFKDNHKRLFEFVGKLSPIVYGYSFYEIMEKEIKNNLNNKEER